MFYLNTIEQSLLFVEQLDQLEVCLPYSRLLTGIPILAEFQNLLWNSNKTSLHDLFWERFTFIKLIIWSWIDNFGRFVCFVKRFYLSLWHLTYIRRILTEMVTGIQGSFLNGNVDWFRVRDNIESFHRSNQFHFAVYWSNQVYKFLKKQFRKISCRCQE